MYLVPATWDLVHGYIGTWHLVPGHRPVVPGTVLWHLAPSCGTWHRPVAGTRYRFPGI